MSGVEKNKGLFARLFGDKSSRCCAMEFEEGPAPEAKTVTDSAEKPANEPVSEVDSQDGGKGEDHVSAST